MRSGRIELLCLGGPNGLKTRAVVGVNPPVGSDAILGSGSSMLKPGPKGEGGNGMNVVSAKTISAPSGDSPELPVV